MIEKDPTKRFSDKVAYYDKFRPRYPVEMIKFLEERTSLNQFSIFADIGSGTGISSEIFLHNRNDVFAVEPNDDMRMVAERKLPGFRSFHSVSGTAENTGLKESSVDFVLSAQAFHWFNKGLARKEFSRILKPRGWVLLAWNERKTEGPVFLKEYDNLLIKVSDDYENINHTQMTNKNQEVFHSFFGRDKFSLGIFPNEQVFDLEGLIGRTLSCSYVPGENEANYTVMMNGIKELFDKYQQDGLVKFDYDTKLFFGKLE